MCQSWVSSAKGPGHSENCHPISTAYKAQPPKEPSVVWKLRGAWFQGVTNMRWVMSTGLMNIRCDGSSEPGGHCTKVSEHTEVSYHLPGPCRSLEVAPPPKKKEITATCANNTICLLDTEIDSSMWVGWYGNSESHQELAELTGPMKIQIWSLGWGLNTGRMASDCWLHRKRTQQRGKWNSSSSLSSEATQLRLFLNVCGIS